MFKCILIGFLLLQAPGAGPGKDPKPGPPQTLVQSSPTPISSSIAHNDDRAGSAWVISLVTAIALVIYTAFAGLQWLAIRKQASSARDQVSKMQGQLDEMKRQEDLMERGLEETRKITSHNEQIVKTMQGQLDAINRQEGHLSTQAQAALAQAITLQGQLAAMQNQLEAINRQEKVLNKQAKTMDRSLVLGARAYLGVHSISLDTHKKRIFLQVENIGKVPAKDIEVVVEIRVEVPETKYQAQCRGPQRDWEKKGHAKLRVQEVILYSDGFHSGKKTEFAFRYFLKDSLWVPQPSEGFDRFQTDPEKPDSDYNPG